ncbi:MAG: YebC/PmpR family DNA-binding transcriptional regulator [Patescibacteria group bacterium]|nr:YebC/PmpR family DNA-binding transcriptional regulator [Patescibacteria group bacterium]
MSGHSKWSTIKHKKAIQDNKRGQIFTKLGKAIAIAAREGGVEVESNFKLRLAVDKAKQFNMPKMNIERAIEKGGGVGAEGGLDQAVYEGFGPGKVAVIVEVVTDNKNRSVTEIKKVFEKNGGVMGQPGAVAFMFDRVGLILVEKSQDGESQQLAIIDMDVEDVQLSEHGVEVRVGHHKLSEVRHAIEAAGYKVLEADLTYLPKAEMDVDQETREKIDMFVEELEDHDDVHNVFTNLN